MAEDVLEGTGTRTNVPLIIKICPAKWICRTNFKESVKICPVKYLQFKNKPVKGI
jgi:hypothetical protein